MLHNGFQDNESNVVSILRLINQLQVDIHKNQPLWLEAKTY